MKHFTCVHWREQEADCLLYFADEDSRSIKMQNLIAQQAPVNKQGQHLSLFIIGAAFTSASRDW